MIRIVYDPMEGQAVPDGFLDEMIRELKKAGDVTFVTSSSIFIDAVRLAIKEKTLNFNKVVFEFRGKEMTANEQGKITYFPPGFCSIHALILQALCKSGD